MKKAESRFLSLTKGTALLAGTTIGAGVLAIPYAISQSGYWIGMIHLVAIGVAMIVLNLFLAEISLRTKGTQQLPGLAERYLGKDAKVLTFYVMLSLIYGALTAYMMGSGQILAELTGLPVDIMGLLFFFFVALGVYFGVKAVSRIEMLFVIGLVFIVIGIALRAMQGDGLQWESLMEGPETGWQNIFIPYGTVLFSYFGFVAVPEMEKIMNRYRQDMQLAIILGLSIPIMLYILFTTVVLGVAGGDMNEVATVALGRALGPEVQYIANIFGLIAMFTSSLSLALSVISIYKDEFEVPHTSAVMVTLLPPITIVLAGVGTFFEFISFAGAVAGSILGILVVFMYWQAKTDGDTIPEFSLGRMRWAGIGLICLMLLGMVSVVM